MNIAFILSNSSFFLTCGSQIIYEHAKCPALVYPDIHVRFYCLSSPDIKKIELAPTPFVVKKGINWVRSQLLSECFSLRGNVWKMCVFTSDDASIPDRDWIFAATAFIVKEVATLLTDKGKRSYLVQKYEVAVAVSHTSSPCLKHSCFCMAVDGEEK